MTVKDAVEHFVEHVDAWVRSDQRLIVEERLRERLPPDDGSSAPYYAEKRVLHELEEREGIGEHLPHVAAATIKSCEMACVSRSETWAIEKIAAHARLGMEADDGTRPFLTDWPSLRRELSGLVERDGELLVPDNSPAATVDVAAEMATSIADDEIDDDLGSEAVSRFTIGLLAAELGITANHLAKSRRRASVATKGKSGRFTKTELAAVLNEYLRTATDRDAITRANELLAE